MELYREGRLVARDGPCGQEGHVYQQLHTLPKFDDRYPVIGAWIVGAESAGICIREDTSPITSNLSNFISLTPVRPSGLETATACRRPSGYTGRPEALLRRPALPTHEAGMAGLHLRSRDGAV